MKTYISLLRGINVSGHKIIKMVDLVKMYENLGFQNVKTYVQSGNIVFRLVTENTINLEKDINNQIKTVFGFDVPVFVFASEKLIKIINENPFTKNPVKDTAFLHVTFLANPPGNFNEEEILSQRNSGEELVITSDAVYLYCPNGYGRTKLNNNFLEQKLGVKATTRNWKTTLKLLDLSKTVME